MADLSNYLLAIDVGNTRVKWGLFNTAGEMAAQGACLHTELASLKLPEASRTVVSNVAGNGIETHLLAHLQSHANVQIITSQAAACGVKNSYSHPEKLGTDRWAAIIAAWHLKQAPCVVVNAGTAVTIDAVHDANFMGGLIMPGMDLMQQSLYLATAQLPIQPARNDADISIFARNTNDAIYAGTLCAITGAISQMAQQLQIQSSQMPWILLSGGNAAIIHRHFVHQQTLADVTNHAIIVDNLVLQGLFLLGNAQGNAS